MHYPLWRQGCRSFNYLRANGRIKRKRKRKTGFTNGRHERNRVEMKKVRIHNLFNYILYLQCGTQEKQHKTIMH